jgi:imidazolonepropionase-like amidohydrolase
VTELLLKNGSILDPDTVTFRSGVDILVRDGVIVALGDGASETWAPTARVMELNGSFVVPGLIDSHYHLVSRSDVTMDSREVAASMIEGVVNARDCVASGVTAVRDCGCRHEGIYPLRSAIAARTVVGPDSWLAGRNPTGVLAPAHWRNVVVTGAEEMRLAVRQQHEAGADWVKLILAHAEDPFDWGNVTEFLDDDEIAAAVDEAHSLGISIGGHTEGWDVAARAVRLGLDILDHAPLLSLETTELMAARGTFYVPTVWAFSDDSGLDDSGYSAEQLDALAGWQEQHRTSVRRARASGVRIAAGSDSADAVTGRGVLAKELHALHRCGLTTKEVLAAATTTAAELLGRADRVGRIAQGLDADLLVVAADPLEDLGSLERPEFVIVGGELAFDSSDGGLQHTVDTDKTPGASVRRWA